jgi:ATP-dependent RNA helicase DDX49/DBP8
LDLTGILTPPNSQSSSVQQEPSPDFERSSIAQPPRANESNLEDCEEISPSTEVRRRSRRSSNQSNENGHERHQPTGALRPVRGQQTFDGMEESQRQMQPDDRSFPKRRKLKSSTFSLQPSTLDKLIIGIWEQIHGSINLDPGGMLQQYPDTASAVSFSGSSTALAPPHCHGEDSVAAYNDDLSRMSIFCRKITQASRTCRSIELIVQARWIEHFDAHVQHLSQIKPQISYTKHRKATLMQACTDFGWTEKELRNKMAIWTGYKEVKDAAGWVALVFSGMGIYRFCKYRIGFEPSAMQRLKQLKPRFEVAADTLHPNWRTLLTLVGENSRPVYAGHPHDWVIQEDGEPPIPLRSTYLQWDPYFSFEHLEESVIDNDTWGCDDPRWIPPPIGNTSSVIARRGSLSTKSSLHICENCNEPQSDEPKMNQCFCFPVLYGSGKRLVPPVQVFRTRNGRNNGLQALVAFDRGSAIGEFTGLITRGLQNLDVMDSATPHSKYQIWQGRQGNYTRFINHSCKANAQFQRFVWCNTQRVVLVSKGIEAGTEITVDYSDRYWGGLDKKCLCGEACCRYRREEKEG